MASAGRSRIWAKALGGRGGWRRPIVRPGACRLATTSLPVDPTPMARPPRTVAPTALLLSLLLWLVAAAPAGAAPVDAGKIVTTAELEPEPDPWEETGDEGEWEDVGEEEEDLEEEEEEEEGGDETVDTRPADVTVRSPATSRVRARGLLRAVRVACPPDEDRCALVLTLRLSKARGKRLALAVTTVAGGETASLSPRLTGGARRLLRRRRSLKAVVVVRVTDAAGNVTTRTGRCTLRS